MTVWETTVRTGSPAADQQMLDHIRRTYEPQGLVVQVEPIADGGMRVRVNHEAKPWSYGGPSPAYAAAAQGSLTTVGSDAAERVRYLRKVYGLLAVAVVLAIGAGFVVISPLLGVESVRLDSHKTIHVPIVVAILLANRQTQMAAFAILFVSVIAASFVSRVRGLNYLALFGVAILMGIELAPMAFVAQIMAGMGATLSADPVRDAFTMVGGIFLGLTGYVFIARKNFSYLFATLTMGFVVVCVGCTLAFALDSEPLSLAIASVGALLSIGFLLYQTSYIMRNSDMDDPVDDALGLLVQLRNLFMFVLRIFMSRR